MVNVEKGVHAPNKAKKLKVATVNRKISKNINI